MCQKRDTLSFFLGLALEPWLGEAYVQVVTCMEERDTHLFVPNNFRKILFSNNKLKEKDCAFFGIPVVKQANN